jgi:hypothetical protein
VLPWEARAVGADVRCRGLLAPAFAVMAYAFQWVDASNLRQSPSQQGALPPCPNTLSNCPPGRSMASVGVGWAGQERCAY